MEQSAESNQNILYGVFDELEKRAHEFVLRPGKDFIGRRKLPFAETLKTISILEGNSLDKELCDIHNIKGDKPFISKSTFVQRRGKIKHEAFEEAFRMFNAKTSINDLNLFKGHRLLAIDGSDVNIALN